MRNPLPTEINTPTTERKIRRAVNALGYRGGNLEYEHGHWWLVLKDGSIFDVVDAEGPNSADGFALEVINGAEDGS